MFGVSVGLRVRVTVVARESATLCISTIISTSIRIHILVTSRIGIRCASPRLRSRVNTSNAIKSWNMLHSSLGVFGSRNTTRQLCCGFSRNHDDCLECKSHSRASACAMAGFLFVAPTWPLQMCVAKPTRGMRDEFW